MQGLISWLEVHPSAIYLAIGIVAFLESFAVVGVLLPGVALLVTLAALGAESGLSILPLLVCTAAGCILADSASFLIGRHYTEKVHLLANHAHHENWYIKGHKVVEKWGWIAYPVGRFIGPLRPLLPLLLGTLDLPKRVFFSLNLLSGLLWAPMYVAPGYYLGSKLNLGSLPWQWILPSALVILLGGWLIRKRWTQSSPAP
jgi:undecaprenyl-diphosphatase